MEFSTEILFYLVLIFSVSAFVHGNIGFGFPIVATPLLALVTDLQTAIILTLIPTLLVNIISIASEGDMFDSLRRHFPLALQVMIGGSIGTLLLIYTNSHIFEVFLAAAILMYLLLDRVNLNLQWINQWPRLSKLVFGVLAGLLGGMTNVMAPVLIIYALESNYSKRDTIQASNLCFLSGKLIQLALFSAYGKINPGESSIYIVILLFVSISIYLGIQLRKKINVNLYKKLLRSFLLLLAVMLVLKVLYKTGIVSF